jgi:hypothetical protein
MRQLLIGWLLTEAFNELVFPVAPTVRLILESTFRGEARRVAAAAGEAAGAAEDHHAAAKPDHRTVEIQSGKFHDQSDNVKAMILVH